MTKPSKNARNALFIKIHQKNPLISQNKHIVAITPMPIFQLFTILLGNVIKSIKYNFYDS